MAETQTSTKRTSAAPLLLTIPQAAELLGIGRSTAYELVATRQLEVVHIGRAARVPVEALHEYVDRLRAAASERPTESW